MAKIIYLPAGTSFPPRHLSEKSHSLKMLTQLFRTIPRLPLFCLIAGHCLLTALPANPVRTENATVELIADRSAIVPGDSFNVALTFTLKTHWHIYWQNPGASGLPVEVEWTLPEGVEADEIIWPTPERIALGGLINYGYEDAVTFVVPIHTSKTLSPGQALTLKAYAFWLICKEACLPEEGNFEITIHTAAASSAPSHEAAFQSARNSWPQPKSPWPLSVEVDEGQLAITLHASPNEGLPAELYFYAAEEGLLDPNSPQQLEFPSSNTARLLIPLAETFAIEDFASVDGVLQSPDTSWRASIPWETAPAGSEAASLPATSAVTSTAPSVNEDGGFEAYFLSLGLPGWLLLAFLGGAILNVMPCVLPVLSLKVFSLLSHTGESRKQSLLHGLAYTAGVVVSFLFLAGVLIGLRALGERIGWGFQLQSPTFIVVLFMLFFLFALNLMGVFEIGTSLIGADTDVSKRKDLAGSFGMGVLAAVVGAPCVGPLLASVGGIAVQAAPATGLLIFAVMGLGLATPFLVLAVFPKLVSYLPKPGAWMETFKHIMGFFLFAAAIFLTAVAGASGGVDAVLPLLLAALFGGVAAWAYGRWAAPVKPKKTRLLAGIFSTVTLTLVLYLTAQAVRTAYDAEASKSLSADSSQWGRWSEARVEAELAAGHPVFVDFTAAWCLICQVNKKVALRTEDTTELFADRGIVALEADWTRYDPAITSALESYGRSGVPLYLLYSPDGSVEVLPQSLTPGLVRDAVVRALDN